MSLLDFRKLWPNDFAMEPQPVYAEKETELASQLVKTASQDKYGTPDPTFSFSHLSDYLANAGESAGKAAGLPQYSEANPPPWAEGAASHAPQAAPNVTAEDITSGRWGNSGGVAGSVRKGLTDLLNMPSGVATDARDAITSGSLGDLKDAVLAPAETLASPITGLDTAVGHRISGPVLNSFLDQSGNVDTNLGNLPGNIASAAVQANPVARGIRGAILQQNPYGGEANTAFNRFQASDAPAGLKTAANYATPLAFTGGSSALGMRGAVGGIAGAGVADQIAVNQDAPDWARLPAQMGGAAIGATVGHNPAAVLKLGEGGNISGAPLRILNKLTGGGFGGSVTEDASGGLHAPGLDPVQQRIGEAVSAAEQALPERAAANQALHGQQGSTYREELARLQAAGVDDLTASRVAAQLTKGMAADVTPARYVINQADVPDLVKRASAEYAAGNINDFEHRRIMDILREADAGPRALGPQHEIDLFKKTYGLDTVDALNANGPTFAPKNEYPTMGLPGFGPETTAPPMRTVGGSEQLAGEAAAASTDTRGAAGWSPDPAVDNPTAKPLAMGEQPLLTPEGALAIPEPGATPAQPMTTEAIHGPTGRAAVPEPGIYDASMGWGPATPAEMADPGVMASRRALVERDLGMVEQRPNAPTVEELTRRDAALNAAKSEADKALIRADPATLTPSELGRRDYLLSVAEPGPTLTDKAVGAAKDIANAGIPAKAGVDASYVLRQSLPLLARNLIFDRPAAAKALKTGASLLRHPSTADAVTEAMLNDKAFGVVTEKMGVKLNAVSAIKDDALVRDPIFGRGKYNPIGKVYGYTERANELYLDTLRYQTAKGMLETLIKKAAIEGGTVSDEALKQIGTAINHGTGRGTGRWVDWLSSAPVRPLFSAQNLMAKPQMIADMFRMEGPARQLAIQQTIAYGAAITGFNALVWAPKLLGLPHADIGVDTDPNGLFGLMGGNFGRAQVGGNSIDLSGGFAGNVRSAAQYAGSLSTAAGADKYGVPGYSGATSSDILSAWGRGKLSPSFAFTNDNLVAHENYDKTPVDWKSFGGVATQLNNAFGNLGVNDIVKAGQEELAGRETVGGMAKGALSTFALGALALLGAGMNSGLSPTEQMKEARDSATSKMFPGQKYDDLSGSDKAKVNQDPSVAGFNSQVQNDPANKTGKFSIEFDQAMQNAKSNFTTTKPDGTILVNDGVGYRKAFQDAAKTKHDELKGAGIGEGKDDVLNGWYALYNAPGIQKQLQAKDYSGIDALQEQYTAAHPEIVDKLAKSVGAKDDPIMMRMRQAAAEAKQYYAIPKYTGMTESEATAADKLLSRASSMVNNRQGVASQAQALSVLMRDGGVSQEQVQLALRASKLGTSPERKQFQATHPLFATFYKGADEAAGAPGTVPFTSGSSALGPGLGGGLGGGLTGGLR